MRIIVLNTEKNRKESFVMRAIFDLLKQGGREEVYMVKNIVGAMYYVETTPYEVRLAVDASNRRNRKEIEKIINRTLECAEKFKLKVRVVAIYPTNNAKSDRADVIKVRKASVSPKRIVKELLT